LEKEVGFNGPSTWASRLIHVNITNPVSRMVFMMDILDDGEKTNNKIQNSILYIVT
jgi:hypothetical protein